MSILFKKSFEYRKDIKTIKLSWRNQKSLTHAGGYIYHIHKTLTDESLIICETLKFEVINKILLT